MATPIENNTEGLQEILQIANSLPSTQKYGKLVVFGDSIGEGANNDNYSYVDVLEESGLFSSVVKACVSGATIGPYQTSSGAINYDLNSQIERYKTDVQGADIILLQYAGNDVFSVLNGNVQMGKATDSSTETTVCGYMQKALDRIYALNPNAKVHWVSTLPTDWELANSYQGNEFADTLLLFFATALRKCWGNDVFIIQSPYTSINRVSSDGIHPNTTGHKYIADLIVNGLFGINYSFPNERVVTAVGSVTDTSALTVNVKYANLIKLLEAGVPTRMILKFDAVTFTSNVVLTLMIFNEYQISFGNVSYDGMNPYPIHLEVIIGSDDSLRLLDYFIGSVQ